MKVTLNIEKRYAYIIIGLLVLGVSVLVVGAYVDSNGVGHDPSQIGPGSFAGGGDYVIPVEDGSRLCLGENCITSWPSGGGSFDLVNGYHSSSQCVNEGGTVVDDGDGKDMCKFSQASCPTSGLWQQYQQWSTTTENSGNYLDETVATFYGAEFRCRYTSGTLLPKNDCTSKENTCATNGHSWSNIAQESNICKGIQATGREPIDGTNSQCTFPVCQGATDVTVKSSITEIGCY